MRHMRLLLPLFILLNIILLALAIIHLPVHWDDGWNLCVARYWFQDGHYGCQYLGNFTSARLSTGWVPVALARYFMEFVGVTYLASRIGSAAFVILAMVGLYCLTKAYTKSTNAAFISVALACFLTPDLRLNPLLLAAQGFSEVISMALLVWGFLLLNYLLKEKQPKTVGQYLYTAALFFGTLTLFLFAGKTKELCFHFLLPALFLSGIIFLFTKKFRQGFILILLALLIYVVNANFHIFYYPNSSYAVDLTGSSTVGIKEALGFNPDLNLRIGVIKFMAKWYWLFLPVIFYYFFSFKCGLLQAQPSQITSHFAKATRDKQDGGSDYLLTLPLFLTFILWSGWFFLLSIDFPRYYSIPAFLFFALSGKPILIFIKLLKIDLKLLSKALIVIPLTYLALQIILTPIISAKLIYSNIGKNEELKSFAKEINNRLSNTNPEETSSLETYESQIFHLLDIPYRYPPDQINVEAILAARKDSAEPIYIWDKPLPACVLVGGWSSGAFGLYNGIENDSRYKLVKMGQDFKLWCLNRIALSAFVS